ncbi:MAG: ATP synthase F0 subunit B [Acidimicrobiales bacterium]
MSDQTYTGPNTSGRSVDDADGGPTDAGVEGILDELIDIVAAAKSMPLSASVMISRDEVLELLEAAREELPEELRRAKRLLKDREEVFVAARREAGEISDDARVQAERLVQRTEIVRQAEYRAVRIVEDAEAEARRLRHEAEDYVDQKLAGFEIVLDRTMKTVRAGRERLAAVPADPYGDGGQDAGADGNPGAGSTDSDPFFDQDIE